MLSYCDKGIFLLKALEWQKNFYLDEHFVWYNFKALTSGWKCGICCQVQFSSQKDQRHHQQNWSYELLEP
jgi:hypothetical protein